MGTGTWKEHGDRREVPVITGSLHPGLSSAVPPALCDRFEFSSLPELIQDKTENSGIASGLDSATYEHHADCGTDRVDIAHRK